MKQWIPLIISAAGVVAALLLSYRKCKSVLSPAVLVMAGVLFILGLGPLLHYRHIVPSDDFILSMAFLNLGLIVGMLAFAQTAFAFSLPRRRLALRRLAQSAEDSQDDGPEAQLEGERRRWGKEVLFGRCLLIVSCVCFSVVLASNIIGQSDRPITELYRFDTYIETMESTGSLVSTLDAKIADVGTKVGVFIYALGIGTLLFQRRRAEWTLIVVTNTIFLCSALTRYGGRQGVIALVMLTFVSFFMAVGIPRWTRILAVVSCLLVAFFALQTLRHYDAGASSRSFNDFVASIGSGGEWERYECAEDLIDFRNTQPLKAPARLEILGNLLYNWTVNWIPRAFWENKPRTDWTEITSNELYSNVYKTENWVRNFTILGQGYYVGGSVGVLIVGLLYGATFGGLLRLLALDYSLIGVRALIIMYAIYSIGNNYTTFLFYGISAAIVTWILHTLLFGYAGPVFLGMMNRGARFQRFQTTPMREEPSEAEKASEPS